MKNQENQNEDWKVLVYLLDEIRKEKGMTHEAIAEITGKSAAHHVGRYLNAKTEPGLGQFLALAKAVGVNFFFEDKEGKSDLNQAFEKAMERLGRRPDSLPKN